jgi:3-deoxy-7-phosphoheptulonate synthase
MLIIMKPNSTPQQIETVVGTVKKHGLTPHITHGVETTIIAAVGEFHTPSLDPFEVLEGVESVKRISQPYKLGSRQAHPENSVFPIDGFTVGGDDIVVIAGPCSVESRSQIIETAQAVREAGANALRGGVFKPRTSPYSFQGLGEEGLEYLADAREQTGMPIVVEIMSQTQLDLMLKYVDVFQVGARNMQNFTLLRELGRTRKPILLKRGIAATMEEWLLSAEYILAGGNKDVILCERGIRTFETFTRNTLDLSAIPIVKELSHLPIFVDPSHGMGRRDKVAPMARAAVAAGADGLIIEVHNDPDHAMSDGAQSMFPAQFDRLMAELRIIAPAIGRSICLEPVARRGWAR